MRHAILLTAAAVLVAACSAPDQSAGLAVRPVDPASFQTQHDSTTPNIARWSAYRQFNFASTSVEISSSDESKLTEIVAHLDVDSSLDIGIDGTLDRDAVSEAERELSARRAASVRRALMDTGAGVPSYKISIGPFGDPGRRRSGQIQVLIGPRAGSPKQARCNSLCAADRWYDAPGTAHH